VAGSRGARDEGKRAETVERKASRRTPSARTGGGDDWGSILEAMNLKGPVSQLAEHCLLVGQANDVIRLRLDKAGEVYRRAQLEKKLGQALAKHFGHSVRLEFTLGEVEQETPAQKKERAAQEKLKAAEQAIDGDPAVRAMQEVFGAKVQPGSVKPVD
jgi:DNA polymerase-3 subunit gamma/tau